VLLCIARDQRWGVSPARGQRIVNAIDLPYCRVPLMLQQQS
jgi:hypothetical protein